MSVIRFRRLRVLIGGYGHGQLRPLLRHLFELHPMSGRGGARHVPAFLRMLQTFIDLFHATSLATPRVNLARHSQKLCSASRPAAQPREPHKIILMGLRKRSEAAECGGGSGDCWLGFFGLVPASPAVPTAAPEKQKYEDND